MCGTSADAVDAALLESDGEAEIRLVSSAERPLLSHERDLLRAAAARARAMPAPGPDPLVAEAEAMLTRAHAEAVEMLAGWQAAELVGFHGATLAHRPDCGWTWQAGDGPALARCLGRPVVYDFRRADMEAGGEGAPLAPGFHRALAAPLARPLGILNIGGVANLTWLSAEGAWGAFDTGPGNALLDDWVQAHGLGTHDRDGALASAGRVRADVLACLLDNPWFDRSGPRSLDRDDFGLGAVRGLAPEDGAATLAAFVAEAVAIALRSLPTNLPRLLVCGGGRRNPAILAELARRTGAEVLPCEAVGWDGDSLEAQAFGWLAVRHVRGLPGSWPETTGCRAPVVAGRLAPA